MSTAVKMRSMRVSSIGIEGGTTAGKMFNNQMNSRLKFMKFN